MTAVLPQEAIGTLRQRGVTEGTVLWLMDDPHSLHRLEPAAEFALLSGTLCDAACLARRDLAAVVVTVEETPLLTLEASLRTLAKRLACGVPLVLVQQIGRSHRLQSGRSRPVLRPRADEREATNLLLWRCGFNGVWALYQRDTLCISARRAADAPTIRTCSIIVPVFNERDTFPSLMRKLLSKPLDHLGLEREIILVESNSNDGTRDLVAQCATEPGVRVLWQDRPLGKGNAVRAGLAAATGDIVLIQDADLEYDVDDYDVLLRPLLQDRAAFVLGSRYRGRSAIRQFADQRWLGHLLNTGHILFTALINLLYRQRLSDPFTMFKVFRRECLYGLRFECDWFDFDHELLIKLLLKGYHPIELPVRYRSRSFKEGKKIRIFRDALLGLLADMKYRLVPLRPHLE